MYFSTYEMDCKCIIRNPTTEILNFLLISEGLSVKLQYVPYSNIHKLII